MYPASAPSHWRAPAPADPNAITAVAGPLQPHPDAVARAAAFGRAAVALLDRLVAADDPFRAKAPVIAQRIRPPHFRPLRSVLVPRTRVEIAKRLVLHQIHFAEELDPHLIRVAVINRDVVPDDVTAGTPNQMDIVFGEPFAGSLNFGPVLDLEGDVVELRHFIDHEIDRVVIGSAAQERERLIAPIRHAKAQYVGIELHDRLHIP